MSIVRAIALSTVLACWVLPVPATADALTVVNQLRAKECKAKGKAPAPFAVKATLAVAARHLVEGATLRDALERAGYRADQSAVIRVGGAADDRALKRLLAKSYCATVGDAGLTHIGIYVGDQQVSMVFAAPFAPPPAQAAEQVAMEVLKLVNVARSQPKKCGGKKFAAAPLLQLNERLARASLLHAKDMASRGQVGHKGADGSAPGDRATRAGYKWQAVGENVAAGQLSAAEVVNGWLASPGHCANIMDPEFSQMGVAYVVNAKSERGIFWAQLFGRPQ